MNRRRFLSGAAGSAAWLALPTTFAPPTLAQSRPQPSCCVEYPTIPNIVYGTVSGVKLLADLYAPTNRARQPWPWITYIHGGGWGTEPGIDKSEIVSTEPGAPFPPTLLALQAAGYAVISIDYRDYPSFAWPAEIEDCKLAVRSFRANAAAFGLDATRVGVWGSSAGGQLAQLCGSADASAGWDVGAYPNESSTPLAVVTWYGPSDLSSLYQEALAMNGTAAESIATVFGTDAGAQLAASPITYNQAGDPPIGFWQGVDDTEVYPNQMTIGVSSCTVSKIPVDSTLVENAGHGFAQVGPRPISPSLQQIAQEVVGFVGQYV